MSDKSTREYNAENRTHWDDSIVAELLSCFRDGLNVSQSCWQVGISRNFFYDKYNSDDDFKDKIDKAKNHLSKIARIKVGAAITKGDMKTARWYLERRDKDDFSARTEVTGRGGKPLVSRLDPEEIEKLDRIWGRKHGKSDQDTDDSSQGDDNQVDQAGRGSEI